MTASWDPLNPPWWVVRSVVDITVAGVLSECEDRFVLIKADSEAAARAKGEREAEEYGTSFINDDGESVIWSTRGISDVRGILDSDVIDGTELYSAFIDSEMAAILLTPRKSPLQIWEEANPGKDPNGATVREVLRSSEPPENP
jgi:Domain of unknown function (DUF4288)